MTTPMFTIGGLGSGLDTASIINQLMQVERQPVVRFQQRQTDLRTIDSAWSAVVSKMSGLRSAASALRQPTGLSKHLSVSSSSNAVTATLKGGTEPASLTFSVERLATRHQVVAGTTPFGSADALVGQASMVVRDVNGQALATVETSGTTTLAQLAGHINKAQDRVSAQVVRTGDESYRLVLTARESGAASSFTIDTDLVNLQATPEGTTAGLDAHLKVGTLDVFRSSNTVTDLLPGVELTLRETTANPVTVTAERNIDGMVTQVKGYVDALNQTLAVLKQSAKSDTGGRGALAGESLVRRLEADLRNAATGLVQGVGSGPASASAIGISVQRDGTFAVDETKLRAALADDAAGVSRLFARNGTATDERVGFVSSGAGTEAGDHSIAVTAAARVAVATGAAWSPPVGNPKTFSVTANGKTVNLVIDVGDGVASAVAKINGALRTAGIAGVTASDEAGALKLTGNQYGSTAGFDVSGTDDPALDGQHRGTDVVGTINGVAATAKGQMLTGASGAAAGLQVRVTASQAEVDAAGGDLALGQVSVSQGLAATLSQVLEGAVAPGGSIDRARDNVATQLRRYDERIAEYEDRLAVRERSLRSQFTAMEKAMAQLSSQGSWMSSQFASLSAQSGGK